MRQAIETKYVGPTNHRGARIIAKAWAGKVIVPYDHAKDIQENHAAAAKAFAAKMGWSGNWFGGGRANGSGYVFVWVGRQEIGACAFHIEEPKVAP